MKTLIYIYFLFTIAHPIFAQTKQVDLYTSYQTHSSITDVVGQEVYNTKPNDSQIINVNISNFANGVYFVKLNNNNDSFTLKIIKQ